MEIGYQCLEKRGVCLSLPVFTAETDGLPRKEAKKEQEDAARMNGFYETLAAAVIRYGEACREEIPGSRYICTSEAEMGEDGIFVRVLLSHRLPGEAVRRKTLEHHFRDGILV